VCHCQNNFHQFPNILGPLRAERQCLVLIIMIIVLQPTAFFSGYPASLPSCVCVCCVRRDVAVIIIAVLFLLEQEKKSRLKDFSSFYFFPALESRRWRNRP
jgi:hypothetical protein